MSSVLGTLLMMAVMLTLLPGALMLRAAWEDEMTAQREASERAAYCARHPDVGRPACVPREPMAGYDCRSVEAGAWLCTPQNGTIPSVPTPPAPTPTSTPTTPTLL